MSKSNLQENDKGKVTDDEKGKMLQFDAFRSNQ